MSTLAGEVANPHKTFPLALMLAVILVILMYLLPLLACLGVMTDTSDWKLGFFATVARQVGGQWLAWWMLAAAAVSATPRVMTQPASPPPAQTGALQGWQIADGLLYAHGMRHKIGCPDDTSGRLQVARLMNADSAAAMHSACRVLGFTASMSAKHGTKRRTSL